MLAFAIALRASGHEVTLCAPVNFRELVTGQGIAFVPVGEDIQAYLGARRHIVGKSPLRMLGLLREWAEGHVHTQVMQLTAACAEADVLVGTGILAAGPTAAEVHGIPYVSTVYCPALMPNTSYPPVLVPWQGLAPWLNHLLWKGHDASLGVLLLGPLNEARRHVGLTEVDDATSHLADVDALWLAADAEIAPPVGRRAPTPMGYWFHDDPTPLDADIEAFLKAGPPPVYVGFGSMVESDVRHVSETVYHAVRSNGHRLLLSAGWAGLSHPNPSDRACMVIGATPHHQLFPRLAAVVHHGGAGTTASTLRAGVPQVLVPHLLDQFFWGERLRRLALAPAAVPMEELTVARLGDALGLALDDPKLAGPRARAAARLRGSRGVLAAVTALERLVERLAHRRRRRAVLAS